MAQVLRSFCAPRARDEVPEPDGVAVQAAVLDAAEEAGADDQSAHTLEVAAIGLTVIVVSCVHVAGVGSTVTVVYVVVVATVEVVPTSSPPRSYQHVSRS